MTIARGWTTLLVLTLAAAAGCDRPRLETGDGKQLFDTICARCHGQDGRGEPQMKLTLGVPDMTERAWQAARDDQAIRRTIREGSASKKMPGFGDYFTAEQIDSIVRHVRGLPDHSNSQSE